MATASSATTEVSFQRVRPGPDFRLWFFSQIIDYGIALSMFYSNTFYNLSTDSIPESIRYFALCLIIQGHIAVGLLYLREQLHFWLLGSRVSPYKTNGGLTRTTWCHILQNAAFSQFSSFFLGLAGLIHIENHIEWSWSNLVSVYLQFYALLVLRDWFSLAPLHPLMHSPKWYYLHKTHHQVRKDAQGMHAFHINVIDLVIENTGAPILLFLGQYMTGWQPVGMNFIAATLLTVHDGALHSINPYSVMYFCPVLDFIVKGNICHQLHHALNDGYIQFVPYAHLWSHRRRQEDIVKYNATFKTDFVLR